MTNEGSGTRERRHDGRMLSRHVAGSLRGAAIKINDLRCGTDPFGQSPDGSDNFGTDKTHCEQTHFVIETM